MKTILRISAMAALLLICFVLPALFGALTGVVFGVLVYLAVGGGSALPVCVAVLLMVPAWLRR